MYTDPSLMTAQDYLRIVAHRWYFLAIPVVLAVVGAVALSTPEVDTYRADARVVASVGSLGSAGGESMSVDADAGRQVATEIEVIRSFTVEERAAAAHPELGSLPTPSVTTVGASNVVEISVTAADAQRAADIANAYAEAYLEHSRQVVDDLVTGLESRVAELSEQLAAIDPDDPLADALAARRTALAETLSGLDLVVARQEANPGLIQPATVPSSPVGQSGSKRIAAAGIVGLLAGLALLALFEILTTDRRRDVADVPPDHGRDDACAN